MGAVDARHVHARGDQPLNHGGIVCGFGRQRHHDVHGTPRRRAAQQGGGVAFEQRVAAAHAHRFIVEAAVPGLTGEAVQDAEHLVEVGQHMRFRASERREAQAGESFLYVPAVAMAEAEVVGQVAGAGKIFGGDLGELWRETLFGGEKFGAQCPEFPDQCPAVRLIPGARRQGWARRAVIGFGGGQAWRVGRVDRHGGHLDKTQRSQAKGTAAVGWLQGC